MSEFEIASLDYQVATLAVREWMFWIAVASLFVSASVGGAQCWLIWRGLRTMERASAARDRQLDLAEQRHTENMRRIDEQSRRFDALIEGQAEQRRALDALIEGQAEQRRASAAQTASLNAATASLNAIVEGQADQRRASAAQTRALEALLDRTAPTGA